jgi:hypothetical protein
MTASLVSVDRIRQAILLLRGQKVILDCDLAVLYGVPTKALKQAVKRNIGRFPEDFMLVLTPEEFAEWRSQFVTSKADRMGLRHPPMAFTEQGVAMLSSVLNSVGGERRKSTCATTSWKRPVAHLEVHR